MGMNTDAEASSCTGACVQRYTVEVIGCLLYADRASAHGDAMLDGSAGDR